MKTILLVLLVASIFSGVSAAVTNCKTHAVEDDTKCVECHSGFTLNAATLAACDCSGTVKATGGAGNTPYCVSTDIPDCDTYASGSTCKICGGSSHGIPKAGDATDCTTTVCDAANKKQTLADGTQICVNAVIPNCAVYASATTCDKCSGTFAQASGNCDTDCSASAVLNKKDGTQVCGTAISNCDTYKTDDTAKCLNCSSDFPKASDSSTCEACSGTVGKTLSNGDQKCVTDITDCTVFDATDNAKCNQCSGTKVPAATTRATCEDCADKKVTLNGIEYCVAAANLVPFCKTYSAIAADFSTTTCSDCPTGRELKDSVNGGKVCVEVIANCDEYANDASGCYKCSGNFVPTANKSACTDTCTSPQIKGLDENNLHKCVTEITDCEKYNAAGNDCTQCPPSKSSVTAIGSTKICSTAVVGCSVFLSNGKCSECTSSTEVPTADQTGCEACTGGATNIKDSEENYKVCVTTVIPECDLYKAADKKCLSCTASNGVPNAAGDACEACDAADITTDAGTKLDSCVQDTIVGCENYDSTQKCTECLAGFVPNTARDGCTECMNGKVNMLVSGESFQRCVENVTDCNAYNAAGDCTGCGSSKHLKDKKDGGKVCVTTDITDCTKYEVSGSCWECTSPKVPNAGKTACEDCSSPKTAKTFASGIKGCSAEVAGCETYVSDGKCMDCTDAAKYPASPALDSCASDCTSPKFVSKNNIKQEVCVTAITGCKTYDTANFAKCKECTDADKVPTDATQAACDVTCDTATKMKVKKVGGIEICILKTAEIADCEVYMNDTTCSICSGTKTAGTDDASASVCVEPLPYCATYKAGTLTECATCQSSAILNLKSDKAGCECATTSEHIVTSVSGLKCVATKIEGCQTYKDNGKCNACFNKMEDFPNDESCKCIEHQVTKSVQYSGIYMCFKNGNPITNCAKMQSYTLCGECNSGYTLNDDKDACTCSKTEITVGSAKHCDDPIDKCTTYSAVDKCDACDTGFKPKDDKSACEEDTTNPTTPVATFGSTLSYSVVLIVLAFLLF